MTEYGRARRALRDPRVQLAIACSIALGLGMIGGTTWALWHQAADSSRVAIAGGRAGFAVTAEGGTTAAADDRDVLTVAIGSGHAERLLGGEPSIAIPFDIAMRADGRQGLDYSVTAPEGRPGTVLGSSDIDVFPVAETAACVPGATPSPGVKAHRVTGLDTAYQASKTRTDSWCLTISYTPAGKGAYRNTGTVTAHTADGTMLEASDSWQAAIVPNPAREPEIAVAITHSVRR
ncbi:hypothetical protein NS506_07089 [Nocardia seriolae]|uniref:Uncharacterized protein n=1 Tax=Nocardia seriolae TaxID=37332 RepID=A0ABC8B3U3_9NOCA|nr:hypothetical protein [Nocardia seriolae]APB01114.1 hypothetical protein NS506_07089 [Nocardia seriolae]